MVVWTGGENKLTGDGHIPQQLIRIRRTQQVVHNVDLGELAPDERRHVLVRKLVQDAAELEGGRVRQLLGGAVAVGRLNRQLGREPGCHIGWLQWGSVSNWLPSLSGLKLKPITNKIPWKERERYVCICLDNVLTKVVPGILKSGNEMIKTPQ